MLLHLTGVNGCAHMKILYEGHFYDVLTLFTKLLICSEPNKANILLFNNLFQISDFQDLQSHLILLNLLLCI